MQRRGWPSNVKLARACAQAASTLLRAIHMAVAIVRFSLALRTLVGGSAAARPQVCLLGPRPQTPPPSRSHARHWENPLGLPFGAASDLSPGPTSTGDAKAGKLGPAGGSGGSGCAPIPGCWLGPRPHPLAVADAVAGTEPRRRRGWSEELILNRYHNAAEVN
jgi:hypothetical protein